MSENLASRADNQTDSTHANDSNTCHKPAPSIGIMGKQRRHRNLLLLVEKGSGAGEGVREGRREEEEGSGEEA